MHSQQVARLAQVNEADLQAKDFRSCGWTPLASILASTADDFRGQRASEM
jgi:hypothetical protein